MKKIAILFAIGISYISNSYGQNNTSGQPISGSNFTGFTEDKANITQELNSLTSEKYKSHPEYGVLPYHSPCKDCFEVLQKRNETHRYYVINGSNGKEFYQESSYGNINYYDAKGVLRSIDPRIKPTAEPGVFKASRQPLPVTINIPQRFTSIQVAGKELKVNRDVTLYIEHKDGSVTSLGQPSWSDYTAGDDGVMIHNFYPGIDLEMRVQQGAVESSYRINKPLDLGDGWLVVHDNVALPDGCSYDYSYSSPSQNPFPKGSVAPPVGEQRAFYEGMLSINNEAGTRYFAIASPAAYDENKENNNAINLLYHTNTDGAYDMFVPIDWMNSAERSYPLVIDPFVMGSDTLAQASITGSGYNATCFKNGCQYDLNLNVPAATTITDIRYTFYYQGLNTCFIKQGAFDLTYAGCRSPINPLTWHTCQIDLPGVCQSDSLSCFSDIQSCIPPPQCKSYDMPFVLTFYRCIQPGAGCGFSCINAETPWIMFVRGYYITVSAKDTTICQGQTVNIACVPDSGVDTLNYTFKWYDATGLIGTSNPLVVTPATTTTYIVTAFDCQSQGLDTLTDSARTTLTVTVNPNDNPGFTINPNPVCSGFSVTLTAKGGVDSNCTWILPGATPPNVNEQQTTNVVYPSGGMYNVILQWTSPASGCIFNDTIPITVNPSVVPSIALASDTPICAGDNATFTPDTVNAGNGATYQWFVNSNPVANTFSYSSATLNDGDTVKVVQNSTSALCVSPLDTAFVVMTVNPIVTPAVSINQPGIICKGSTVTFTADTTNGGPTGGNFQWQVNNNIVNNATNITFSSNTLDSGDVVTVIFNSNDPCANPVTATSPPATIQIFPPVTVTATGDTTICAGQPVTICATAANGNGGTYTYSWDNSAGNSNCPGVSPLQTTIYTVSANDSCNGPAATKQVTVTVLPAPTPNFTYSPSDVTILSPTVYFTDQSTNGTPVYWNFGDTTCANNIGMGTNPTHVYCHPGTFTIWLVEANASGCLDSISYTLEINDEYYFYIPNSFTPNGDGKNDFFAPQGTDALQSSPLNYTMAIYDRWGEKVFETDNNSLPWTGYASGGSKIAEAGVYVYRIQFTDAHYTDKVLVGAVTLVR